MVAKKRMILWDWSNSVASEAPEADREMGEIPFGPRSAISSVYNWNAWAPKELHGRAPFRPMVRTMAQTSGSDWDMIENTPEHLILFFNEPERNGISPEQARDIWNRQMLPLRRKKGKKLGSPAVAADVNGRVWISEWMKLVERDPPDFLCLHYYSTDGNAAIGYLQAMHRKFPEHHIMVTEIASIDRNYESVLGFTVQVVNWMDETPWIAEYGLFDFQRTIADNFVSPAAQLMDKNGRFTELGRMYLHDQPMRMPHSHDARPVKK